MRSTAFAAVIFTCLVWGTPPFAWSESGDFDGVLDAIDNCSDRPNPNQDDTDADDCGNLCDADYDNSGVVGFGDFGAFVDAFGGTNELYCHLEPIPGCTVGFADLAPFPVLLGRPLVRRLVRDECRQRLECNAIKLLLNGRGRNSPQVCPANNSV